MDWSIEVSKDFVFIYYFKLKNAVRPKVRCVCMIDCNSALAILCKLGGGHVTRRVFSRSSMFLSVRLFITVSLTLPMKVSFS